MKYKLLYSFFTSTLAAIFLSACFPYLKPVYYAPFLVLCFLNTSFITSLWFSLLSGLIIDLFSSTHMGLHALSYIFSALILYRQKRIFKETLINISIFSIIISIFYSFFNFILLFIFDKPPNASFLWFVSDFIIMPIFDGLYALLFFAIPLKFYNFFKKKFPFYTK